MKISLISLFNRLRLKKAHIVIWLIFISYEVLIAAIINERFGELTNYIIHYMVNISLFYIHGDILLPRLFKKKQGVYWLLIILILIEALIYILFVYNLDLILYKYTNIMNAAYMPSKYSLMAKITWRGLYFILFGTGYYFLNADLSERKVKEKMEKDRLLNIIEQEKIEKNLEIAKNAYLKAQINPHFLFNTLDFIYHDVVQHSPKSAQAVLDLADIMRFALDANHLGEYITLGEEIAQLENLISLHQIRDNGRLQLNLSYKEEVKSLKIIPLVLLTLAENMFKHGNLREKAGQMEIFTQDGYLYITTVNLIDKGKQRSGFGSGLANIKGRLEDAYKGKAGFKYTVDGNCFRVQLSIHIDN